MPSDSASEKAVNAATPSVEHKTLGKVGSRDPETQHQLDSHAGEKVIELGHAAYALPAQKRRGGLLGFWDRPLTQIGIVGFICFLCPGMFNALSGIGGGGQVDPAPAVSSNIAIYACFAGFSFFAGSLHNIFGSKTLLFVGGLGYALYTSSFLSYNFNQNGAFVIAAGAVLGLCAALLWTSQGAIMMSYPIEGRKATGVALFWTIFNLGAVIGSAIAMGLNWNTGSASLSNGTYAAFVALTGCGAFVTLALKAPGKMLRDDGSPVVVPKHSHFLEEFQGLFRVLTTDPFIMALFPLFFASNFFYQWTFTAYNASLFTIRTRSLNSFLYWLAQMFGAFGIGFALDSKRLRRTSRAWLGWAIIFVLTMAVWGGAYHVQSGYTRATTIGAAKGSPLARPLTDVHDSGYGGLAVLYVLLGLLESCLQCWAYWLMGSLSNDLAKLAHFAGFYKCLQSTGAAVAFGLDHNNVSYMNQLATCWALCIAGLLCAAPVILFRITETTDVLQEKTVQGREEELKQINEKVVAALD